MNETNSLSIDSESHIYYRIILTHNHFTCKHVLTHLLILAFTLTHTLNHSISQLAHILILNQFIHNSHLLTHIYVHSPLLIFTLTHDHTHTHAPSCTVSYLLKPTLNSYSYRDLMRTGNSIVMISAGVGVFKVTVVLLLY